MQRQEITKEQYELVTTSDIAIELGILPPYFAYYGFKFFRKLEVEGKYYIEYQLYSSCDQEVSMPDSIIILLVYSVILATCGVSAFIAEHFHNGEGGND